MANLLSKIKNVFSRKSEEVIISKKVFWVEAGKTYHTDRDCPSLKKSKNIKSGTIEESQKLNKCCNCLK